MNRFIGLVQALTRSIEVPDVSAAKLWCCTSLYGWQHALLGFLGQHHEALSRLQVSALLLGLHRGSPCRHRLLGADAGLNRAGTSLRIGHSECTGAFHWAR